MMGTPDDGRHRGIDRVRLGCEQRRDDLANGECMVDRPRRPQAIRDARTRGSALRAALLALLLTGGAGLVLVGWGQSRLSRGEPLPEWLERVAVASGLVGRDRLAAAVEAASVRRADEAVWRHEAANRARALAGVRAVAWDGDRLLVLLDTGIGPTGGRAARVCSALAIPRDGSPVEVRLEALDGQGAPVVRWCGGPGR